MSGIAFYLWGAGGGGGLPPNPLLFGAGGAGAFISGVLYNVTPGTLFRIIIGAGGGNYFCSACPSGSPKLYGYCLDCAPNDETGAGGVGTYSGGGRTALQIWNASSVWEEVATAGGGGGAGRWAYGGAGGCDSGGDGTSYCCLMEGGKNAADGTCTKGIPLRGVSTRSYTGEGSAGSGSGWCGGLSTWDPIKYESDSARGAGGGTSWASPRLARNVTCMPGHRFIPREDSPYRAVDIARGGQGGSGGHGAAILLPFCGASPPIFSPDGVNAPLLPSISHTLRLEPVQVGRLSYTFRCEAGYIGSDTIYSFNFVKREWLPHVPEKTSKCVICPDGWSSVPGASVCSRYLNYNFSWVSDVVRFLPSEVYQFLRVPNNVQSPIVEVIMCGAGGGGNGGAGSFVTGLFDATPGETYRVIVGRTGGYNDNSQPSDALGGGGFGTHGGGGRTTIQRFINGAWIDFATAAGGGGRGGASPGAGGCTQGLPGSSWRGAGIYPGGKANSSGGCDFGSRSFGDSCYSYALYGCGGGGGGYCGGVASIGDAQDGGAGGGSWTANLRNAHCSQGSASSANSMNHPL